jgi:hypothetical protein
MKNDVGTRAFLGLPVSPLHNLTILLAILFYNFLGKITIPNLTQSGFSQSRNLAIEIRAIEIAATRARSLPAQAR